MAEKNQDLGITQKQDGDYTDIVIPNLDLLTTYGLQVAWVYADKEKGTSEFSDVFEFTTPAPRRTCPINVQAVWDAKANLTITWEKPFLADNVSRDNFIKLFQITLTANGLDVFDSTAVEESIDTYSFTLSQQDNMANFGGQFQTTIVGKITSIYGDGSSDDCPFVVPVYVDPICVATTVTPIAKSTIDGILVSWQDPATSAGTYRETKVYLSETNNPYDWELVYTGFGPALIEYNTLNTVYIKINHLSDSGCESIDSPVIQAKILDLVNFKDYPPDEFTNVTSAWIQNPNTLNDLSITFNLPAANPQKRDNIGRSARVYFTVEKDGIPTEEFIDRSFPEPFTHGAQKTIKIFAEEIRGRFLSYNPTLLPVYSNKKGRISSIDQYDNVSPGVPFDIGARVNPLAGHTPTILITAVENGYSVKNINTKSEINYYEVYASKDNNTFSKVYSGILPAFILDISYTLTYVKVIGYTLGGDSSNESSVSTVTPLSVAEMSLIEFPVGLGTEGSIWSGPLQDSDSDGEPDRDENGNLIPISDGARAFFNRRGFFIYDDDDVLTTQIIGDGTLYNNPYAGTGGSLNPNKLTFITKSAQIANWRVSTDRIENTLSALNDDTYTGMSGAGSYAFWAGGNTSGNTNGLALFSVTHAGKVVASNIDVLGGKLRVGGTTDALAPFLVTSSGLLTAAGATINGTINAVSGKMGEIDIGGTMKVLDEDAQSPTFGKYVDRFVSGQMRIVPEAGVKIEMGGLDFPATSADFDADANAILQAEAGIQITNAGNKHVQLDSYNGILANKGWIGGWKIDKSSINKAGTVGLYAPKNPTNTDIAFWAGGSRDGNPGPNFSVTHGGSLIANEATIRGSIEAREGYFGQYSTATKTIVEGWKINGKFLQSFSSAFSDVKVKLDGLQGTIAGGNIVGSNVFFMDPDTWYTNYPGSGSGNPGGVDYISSTGNFRLADGNLTYDGNEFKVKTDLVASNVFLGSTKTFDNDYLLGQETTIGNVTKNAGLFKLAGGKLVYDGTNLSMTGTKIYLDIQSNEDGNFADSTIVQDEFGQLTTGRAFQYGDNNYPTDAFAQSSKEAIRGRAFVKGDIWLSTKA